MHPASSSSPSILHAILAGTLFACGLSDAESYYKEPPLFSTAPNEKLSYQTIDRVGPVGVGLELIKPIFTMRIKNVEEGSPAAAAGLRKGQIITSINGQTLKDIDPRIQLGRLITEAEAMDGMIRMKIADKPDAASHEVTVEIPVLGSYSPSWPLDCPKSEKIVRNYAEHLKKDGANKGFADIGMLFLLSTGDQSDLAYVREWAHGEAKSKGSSYPWHIGYGGPALCEYYLRTGDATVLPAIQARVDRAIEMETFGGWAGRGPLAAVTYGGGGGHLNAGGTMVVTFLMLAKECGAEIPEEPFHRILAHFYRFAGRGNNPYGNNKPESGYTDNGKNGKLAFVMAAAAALTPEGEKSIYAGARDVNAMFSFYSTSYMLHGHTGGGIGEIWRSAAMGLLHDKRPNQYRDFMDKRRWHYELSRRFDGSFGILGGARYDEEQWGAGYALTYTVPRKTLRLTGAPLSKYSKPYPLPARPWGTAADDDFVNPEPPAFADGTQSDLSGETLKGSAAMALNSLLGAGDADRETMHRYLHHRDYMVRQTAARSLVKFGPEVMLEYMHSKDARVRRAAIEAMVGRKSFEEPLLSQAVFDRLIEMLADPEESWFVKEIALRGVGGAPADWVAPHTDLICSFFKHQEWWLQNSAIAAVRPIIADPRGYKKVIPALAELMRTCKLFGVTAGLRWSDTLDLIAAAEPEVRELARTELKEAFIDHVALDNSRGIDALDTANEKNIETIATVLTKVPGGYDVLYQIARGRYPNETLPYKDLFLSADASRFSPELKKAVRRTITGELIPEYIAASRGTLLEQAKSMPDGGKRPAPDKIEGLVDLYQSGDIHDFDWKDYGPDYAEIRWQYHTFDPPEKMPWDKPMARFRPVTLPAGMEDWFKPEFDAGKAGWQTGAQPIGHIDGKFANDASSCKLPFCRCSEPLKTFWENEVLLMRGTLKLPAFEEGRRYRLLVGGMSHVGAGEGYKIHINGKPFAERNSGVGKRAGAKPIGHIITRDWWPEFANGEVTIAATGFQAIHKGKRKNHFAIWFQEMLVPPLGENEILNSAMVVPMRSAAWQAHQDPDDTETDTSQYLFRFDGSFKPDPELAGNWKTFAMADSVEDFDSKAARDGNRAPFDSITLGKDGSTNVALHYWTGNMLMDLKRNEALEMQVKTLNGAPYLFIETGGFNAKAGPDFKSKQIILTRAK